MQVFPTGVDVWRTMVVQCTILSNQQLDLCATMHRNVYAHTDGHTMYSTEKNILSFLEIREESKKDQPYDLPLKNRLFFNSKIVSLLTCGLAKPAALMQLIKKYRSGWICQNAGKRTLCSQCYIFSMMENGLKEHSECKIS